MLGAVIRNTANPTMLRAGYKTNVIPTDAQATVSVRLEEEGRIVTGSSADTDTIVASTKAYINALNRLIIRRQKTAPGEDVKTVSYHGE